jgi:hypothetical protein
MLVARSAPECRLYMDLHACSCGSVDFPARHTLQTSANGALVAVYTGPCARCSLPRRFEFELDPRTPPLPPAFGGPDPSQIICPGQFALVASYSAAEAAAPDRSARPALARALAAQEEVIKFIPVGADAVPVDAFTSEEGHKLYAEDPGRFDGDRLRAVAGSYRDLLASHDDPA